MDCYDAIERRTEADRPDAVITAIVDCRYLAPGVLAMNEWRQRARDETARDRFRVPGSVAALRMRVEALRRGASTCLVGLRYRLQDMVSVHPIPRRDAASRAELPHS